MNSSRDRKGGYHESPDTTELVISGRKPVLEVIRRGLAISVEIEEGAHGTVIEEIRAEARKRGVEVGKLKGGDHPPLTPPAKAGGEMKTFPAKAGGK
jgi:hypothetical protein